MNTDTNGAAEAAAENADVAEVLAQLEADNVGDGQAPEAAPADEPTGEQQQAEQEQGQQPKPPAKPKLTAQQRIDQLTWRANEAERRAQEAEARAAAFMRPRTPGQEPQATPSANGEEPHPDDYQYGLTDPAYIADLATARATARVRQEFEARQAQEREEAARRDFVAKRNGFAAKITETHEGAIALLTDTNAPVTREMAEVLFASDAGVQVADYLGRNYAEAQRIAELPPHLQGVALGRLEARLTTPPKTATDAPTPPPTVRGAGGKFQVAPDTADFSAFDKQYDL